MRLNVDKASAFHNEIRTTYHTLTCPHYGADPNRAAWHQVVWNLDAKAKVLDVETLRIDDNDVQGKLRVDNGSTEFEGTTPLWNGLNDDPADSMWHGSCYYVQFDVTGRLQQSRTNAKNDKYD